MLRLSPHLWTRGKEEQPQACAWARKLILSPRSQSEPQSPPELPQSQSQPPAQLLSQRAATGKLEPKETFQERELPQL